MASGLSALFSGLLFGIGLVVSQMINPGKVLAFLDVAGHWDPSLILVMVGAISSLAIAQLAILKKPKPIFEKSFPTNLKQHIDSPLLVGSILFGIGWGLSGLCPGPAISSLAYNINGSYIFTGAMFTGMWLFQIVKHLRGLAKKMTSRG